MSEQIETALKEAEPIDPEHYFAKVKFRGPGDSPVYGLVDAELPPEIAPPELDEARVVVAERVDDADEFGRRPVLTVVFEEADDLESAVDTDDETDADQAHVGILVRTPEGIGGVPNSVMQSPTDATAIIKRAMAKRRLGRVTTRPEDVFGLPSDRYLNAAGFLVEAGFHRVEGADSPDIFELVRKGAETKDPGSEDSEASDLAAAA